MREHGQPPVTAIRQPGMTYKTTDDSRCMSRFKGWYTFGDLGHQGHTAESTDQGPKRNQDIPEPLRWLVPVPQHMGDRFGDEMPFRSRHPRVNTPINVHMPAPGIAEGHWPMCSVRHDVRRGQSSPVQSGAVQFSKTRDRCIQPHLSGSVYHMWDGTKLQNLRDVQPYGEQ